MASSKTEEVKELIPTVTLSSGSSTGSDSEEGDERNPTEEVKEWWLYARNTTSKNNQRPEENCGKWLIFEPPSQIDDVWKRIKNMTETGQLGFASKVSTCKDKAERNELSGGDNFVICVYTYDHTDEEDAMRVREHLRKAGFLKKLPYKTDAATHAGAYRRTTGGRVSKWYC